MDRTELLFTTDKKKLHKFFLKDPVLYSYHIGDLDDFYFEHCQWAVTYGKEPFIKETALIYYGLDTPSVLAFGQTEAFGPFLENLLDILPGKFFAHYQKQWLDILKLRYTQQPLGTHLKMRLDSPERLREYSANEPSIVRLEGVHEKELRELYARSYPGNYFDPHMLASNRYLGWFEKNRLAAVAGVHVHSDEYEVAVLGNITTDPDYRGKGLATRLTGALSRELSDEKKLVCLNVKIDNVPAIKCYERLGFVRAHEYEEGLFELK